MQVEKSTGILQESIQLESTTLGRIVPIDFYQPDYSGNESLSSVLSGEMALLLINDGQELAGLGLADILDDLYSRGLLRMPLLCVGIHTGAERILEYGTAAIPDYKGRGSRAGAYTRFVLDELLPAIYHKYPLVAFTEKSFAGFSLGALSAMDIVWNHPEGFSRVGLFSGSFWWRTRDKDDAAYDEHTDRIMQRQVREGAYHSGLHFFFECGTEDEKEDRNRNGIIDSIDDTQDLIKELVVKGYDRATEICYLEIAGGKHEVGTWARAMPEFLLWGWGK